MLNRNSDDPPKWSDRGNDVGSRVKCGLNPMKLMGVFVVCLMGISVLFSAVVILRDSTSDTVWAVAETRLLDFDASNGTNYFSLS